MKNMKKLLIAAGIAAATVASFGASAERTYSNTTSSFASVNTIVTGKSGFNISANDKAVSESEFKTANTELGSFAITLPQSVNGFSLKNIHAHNYPNTYEIKITPTSFGGNVCVATVGAGASDINLTSSTNVADSTYQCTFTGEGSGALTLTNNKEFEGAVTPGTRTFTAEFVSYTE